MQLFYTDQFELLLPADHRFPISKYRLLREVLARGPRASVCEFHVPHAATDEQLRLVHTADYVHRVANGLLPKKAVRRIGFPWSPGLVERSRRSTGATIEAARAAISEGVAVNLAGGTHHAFADRGEGFCVFNDVAVAARLMQAEGRILTGFVIDCDVHQGNGTAEIFQHDPTVTTFSIHGKRNYPLKKTNSDLDVALDDGADDGVYLDALNRSLTQLFDVRSPDLVFYLAGADPFAQDRLGKLQLTKQGLRQRDTMILQRCRSRCIPCVIVMAGGYAEDVQDIVEIHATTVREALDIFA